MKVFIFIFLAVLVVWHIAHAIVDIRRAWREWKHEEPKYDNLKT